jgi:hypothetical protein
MQLRDRPFVARYLHVSVSQVNRLKDEIGYIRVGGSIRFFDEDIQRYLESRRNVSRHLPGRPKKKVTEAA